MLSGVIVEHLGWHWLFFVGAPPALAAAALVARLVLESPIRTRARPDYAGATALSIGFAAFLLALSEGDVWGCASPGVLGLLAGAALMLWVWVAIVAIYVLVIYGLAAYGGRPELMR